MKSFMKELKPHSLEDIIAGISLYRPGPMDFIPQYIRGKNDASSIAYDCPQLEPILEPTYGCIVYQEQVMQIVRDWQDIRLEGAISCAAPCPRKKAMSCRKNDRSLVYGDEAANVPGCVKNGIDEKTANKIYDEMIDFAKYAFINPMRRICGCGISDRMAEILLSGGVHGCAHDVSDRKSAESG